MSSLQNVPLQIVYDQPSFTIQTKNINLTVTRIGGQMAPVEFFTDTDNPIQPYHIAPWWDTGCQSDQPPLLQVLRGDFFCCPFGSNDEPFEGRQYPIHGETANRPWSLADWRQDAAGAQLHLAQQQLISDGKIEKLLTILPGESNVYSRHILSGIKGPMDLGHHANLRFPDNVGSGKLAFSKFIFAQVYVKPTETPEEKGYSILSPGAVIQDLKKVPMITGEFADLTQYPARRGFEDIAIICADPNLEFSWTTVTFPEQGYVWYALKNPKVLASTLLWMSNGGRYYEPWNGRHINVMGLEEITAYFHEGIAASAHDNPLKQRGIKTVLNLSKDKPQIINYIQGVARIPKAFDVVAAVEAISGDKIRLSGKSGKSIEVPCQTGFLNDEELAV
ncbi:hypothetical protein JW964_02165 [candidate division KSB1 bacterium]|nr:hypothetical protein [candidate division KSB1 bacterium]